MRTGRTGAAAKAGHDLVIDVTAWQATLEVGDDPAQSSVALDADATSLHVRQGTGGMQALGDDDKADIRETIDEDVLKRQPDRVPLDRSVQADGEPLDACKGDLTLAGNDGADRVRARRSATTARSAAAPSSSRATGASSPTRRCSAR